MTMTHEELEDRLDDIVSMGERRARAHIKALYLDLIGEDEVLIHDPLTCGHCGQGDEATVRDELRHELRSKVGDV